MVLCSSAGVISVTREGRGSGRTPSPDVGNKDNCSKVIAAFLFKKIVVHTIK
jgi:hypothetical protein